MAPFVPVRTLIFATFVLLWSATAAAQVLGRTVVIPYGANGGEQPGPQTVAQVESALVDRRVPLISLHEARDRFLALELVHGWLEGAAGMVVASGRKLSQPTSLRRAA